MRLQPIYLGVQVGIYGNKNLLITSAPRRKIAFTAVLFSTSHNLQPFPELVEITMTLPLFKTSGYHLSIMAQIV